MFKKAVVIATVTMICLLLIPVSVGAQRRVNRYILTGLMAFRYERFSTDGVARNYFRQSYDLNLAGPIWDPRFIVFGAGVSFAQTEEVSDVGLDETLQLRRYNLNAILFPRFNYPLNLYFRRATSENLTEHETSSYGFRWRLRFRKTYPNTTIFFDKTDTSTDGTEVERFHFGVDMDKRIKATDNRFTYRGTISDDKTTRTDSHSISFNNRTKLTRTSILNLGGNYGVTDSSSPTTETTTSFLSGKIDLSLQPSRKLYHSYHYHISLRDYENDGEKGEEITHSLGAALTYQITERLLLREGLSYDRSDTTKGTLKITSQRYSLNSGLTYRLTHRLSTFGDIFYSDYWWSPVHPVTGESSVKRYELRVGLSYVRPFIRGTTLSSNYAIGIFTTDSDRYGSTTGVSHSFNVGISGINFRYFTLSSSYSLSVNTLTDRREYIREEDSQIFRVDAQSRYFKRTVVTASYVYTNIKRIPIERIETDSFAAHINHFLPLWRGTLHLSAGYGTTIGYTESATTRTTNITYGGRYATRLRRNLSMELTVRRDEYHYETTQSNINRFGARFIYRLRAWLISTNYDYIVSEREDYSITESRFMINATRGFRRVFFR